MKTILKYGLVVTALVVSAYAQLTVPASRFTAGANNTYTYDLGSYTSGGQFLVSFANLPIGGSISNAVLSQITGKPVIKQTDWLRGSVIYAPRFSVSQTTYDVAGVPYLILSVGSGTNPGGGPTGGGTTTATAKLINISTRAVIAAGGNLNPGFVISGTGKKTVLVRGVGPGLAALGVTGTLADPTLTVYAGTATVGTNDNWSSDTTQATALRTAFTATGAFSLPNGSKDAAMLLTLDPGTYTAIAKGADGGGGDMIIEVYDVP